MAWSFNPQTQTTDDDDADAPIRSVQLEGCIERLVDAGFRNRFELIRIFKPLTNLSKGEIGFNVDLVLEQPEFERKGDADRDLQVR